MAELKRESEQKTEKGFLRFKIRNMRITKRLLNIRVKEDRSGFGDEEGRKLVRELEIAREIERMAVILAAAFF